MILKRVLSNLRHVLDKKSTKPTELWLSLTMITYGVTYAVAPRLFGKFDALSIIYRKLPAEIVAGVFVTIGVVLLYCLIFQSETTESLLRDEKIPEHLAMEYDDYLGENATYLSARRNSLVAIVGWNVCCALWYFCAAPTSPLWVSPILLVIQAIWSLVRLRRGETVARETILAYKQTVRKQIVSRAIRDSFSDLVARGSTNEHTSLGEYDSSLGTVGGANRHVAGQAS